MNTAPNFEQDCFLTGAF